MSRDPCAFRAETFWGQTPERAFWDQTPLAEGARRRTYHAGVGAPLVRDSRSGRQSLPAPLARLRRHCLRLAGNSTDAEDLVQEAFAALIRRGGPCARRRRAHARHLRPQRPRHAAGGGAPQRAARPTPTPPAAATSRRPSPTGWNSLPSPRPSPGCPSGSGARSRSPAADRPRARSAASSDSARTPVNQLLHRARAGVRAMTAA